MDTSSLLSIGSQKIQRIIGQNGNDGKLTVNANKGSESFDNIFAGAVNMISSTNERLQRASQAEVDYATGKLTSTHELAVIEQEANLSLQYTVAIKNQLLNAYKEIMQMQI